jgi:hypothetical protein
MDSINLNRISPNSLNMIDGRHAAIQGFGYNEEAIEDEDPAMQEEKFKQILEKTKGLRDRLRE